jgi:microcin C transport system permease protein
MTAYLIRRLLLILPTLLGIITVNFFVIQAAPGGPVEQMIARISGNGEELTERISGSGADDLHEKHNVMESEAGLRYRGAEGLDPAFIEELEKMFGFDRPIHERYLKLLRDYLFWDFGESFYKNETVLSLIAQKMPVSISLGLWSTLIIYVVCIPLGIRKAVHHGTRFDGWTTTVISVAHAIPVFLFAIALVIFFAGGSYFQWFPLRGLTSPGFDQLSTAGKILDYFHHLALPITAMVIGGFASLTMLTRNSFLDEIHKQYVETARAKGADEKRVLFGHVFRNAMLIVIAGFPSAFVSMFFTGSLLIEVIFSLDGLGLLGFEATMGRDYPVMFATLYIFTLMGLVLSIVSDLTYTFVDPRIHFGTREGS